MIKVTKAIEMKAALRAARGAEYAEQVEAYINECDHMEGEGYWSEFATIAELIEDFDLYLDNMTERDA